MRVSILSERRSRAPYGMQGGGSGAPGRNTWIKRERVHNEDADKGPGHATIRPDPKANQDAAPDEPLAPDLATLGKGPEELGFADLPQTKGRGGVSNADSTQRTINIGGKATLWMGAGDRLVIETPGGGGWGVPSAVGGHENAQADQTKHGWEARGSVADRERAQAGF